LASVVSRWTPLTSIPENAVSRQRELSAAMKYQQIIVLVALVVVISVAAARDISSSNIGSGSKDISSFTCFLFNAVEEHILLLNLHNFNSNINAIM
jgi:hypothetical protein